MVSSCKVFNLSLGRGAFAMTPCFAELAYSRASLALSPRCRSRSVWAVRPASLAASSRHSSASSLWSRSVCYASRPGRTGRVRPQASVTQVGHSSSNLEAPHAASSLAAFEATIEHARTVPHQSLRFSCAARLPFVERARSAHIRASLVIEASARRFPADA